MSLNKPSSEPTIKKHFGQCFEIDHLNNGDLIPTGGHSILSDEADIKIEGDFENLQSFFDGTRELQSRYGLPQLQQWLKSQGLDIDPFLFSHLTAFSQNFEHKYPLNTNRSAARHALYQEKTGLKLSDILNVNAPQCAEICALAQKYLQDVGVESSYFSGDVLWNKDHEFSGKHSFIVIRHQGKTYLYDPTNPTPTASAMGNFPSIYTSEADFDSEIAKGKKRFVTSTNLLSKRDDFFGTNDGTNVNAEKDIV